MDLLPNLLHLSVIHFLMAMVPGPNTVVVSYYAASRSRGTALRAASGIVLASTVWVSLSLAGIGIVLLEAGTAYRVLRLAGAAYLVWVSYRMLRASWAKPDPARPAAPAGPPSRLARASRAPFVAGLTTTFANPKSAVFWTSVFALVVPAHAPVWFYVAVLAIVAVQSTIWYAGVALVLSTPLARASYARWARWLDRIAGGVTLALGLRLADDVRRELSEAAVR